MRLRSLLGTATTAAGLVAVSLVPGAGSAAASSTGNVGAAAVPPTVSPAADFFYFGGPGYVCPEGNFCARVWDPTAGTYRVYKFYRCATYSLANWQGVGGYANGQTGSRATATFYGQSGNRLLDVPIGGQDTSYDWGPVWKIRNCY
jgi:hypothetical protein